MPIACFDYSGILMFQKVKKKKDLPETDSTPNFVFKEKKKGHHFGAFQRHGLVTEERKPSIPKTPHKNSSFLTQTGEKKSKLNIPDKKSGTCVVNGWHIIIIIIGLVSVYGRKAR